MAANKENPAPSTSTEQMLPFMLRCLNFIAPPGSPHRMLGGRILRSRLNSQREQAWLERNLNPPFAFAEHESPLISIIVPIHGKWDYTFQCLTALAATNTTHSFEVVLVDDKSPDQSRQFAKQVPGLRVIELDENLGYVGACNTGIKHARGQYVVFLNNDTRVTPGWLDPLVETLEIEGVGLVGARLVYPDGMLQDAGGIIFNDASGWNYGKFLDAENHAYTYLRDPDYVSGACTIIRKETLETLGGLDELFAPAYYDDTDLAFAVREMGLRVVYDPRSLVVHDEGISHGTDETQGIKAYQVVNKEKFAKKWAHRLVDHFDHDPTIVEYAARRRNGEKIIVVIDGMIPRPDQDSGSVRRYASLVALRQLGYAVVLIPLDRARTEPYSTTLTNQGIEIFYGGDDIGAFLRGLQDHIAAIMVARLPIATAMIPLLRENVPNIPIIFDTVDLHFLREERSQELQANSHSRHVRYVRDTELAAIRTSDATIVVSQFEKDLLDDLVPESVVHIVSNVHADLGTRPGLAGRSGLIFVGSFDHAPNADGLKWFFREVLPLIENENPGVPVTIVGKNPPASLTESAPPNVTFTGWAPDLEPLYEKARVAIAPLLYGAGVKGKIGEAMSFGLPVVMTDVGAEGMDIKHGETAWVANQAGAFAHGVSTLLVDDDLWQEFHARGPIHIQNKFGDEVFARALKDLLDSLQD